jgi:hypothetical protein
VEERFSLKSAEIGGRGRGVTVIARHGAVAAKDSATDLQGTQITLPRVSVLAGQLNKRHEIAPEARLFRIKDPVRPKCRDDPASPAVDR